MSTLLIVELVALIAVTILTGVAGGKYKQYLFLIACSLLGFITTEMVNCSPVQGFVRTIGTKFIPVAGLLILGAGTVAFFVGEFGKGGGK